MGLPVTDWGCCSSTNQCDIGEGDCDNDNDCTGNLGCGDNNCRRDYSVNGSDWHNTADCCVGT